MKILFVAPYPPTAIRTRSRNLVRQMVEHGHDVVIAALSIPRITGDDAGTAQAGKARLRVVRKSLPMAYLSAAAALVTGESLEVAFCRSRRWSETVAEILAEGIDLVHVEHLRATPAAMHAHVPGVWDAVDSRSSVWRRAQRAGRPPGALVARIEARRTSRQEQLAAQCYDTVLVASPSDRDAFAALAPAVEAVVLRNGVDSAYFGTTARNPDRSTVLMTGVMNYGPNVEAATRFHADAWPRVLHSVPGARLVFAGSSPAGAVRGLAGGAVRVTGYVEDLRQPLAQATVAICPTRLGSGVQNKVLEAMAAGVPVVASTSAARGLGLRHGDHLLVADDDSELADQVIRVLQDPVLARRLGSAGKELVRSSFDWRQVGDQLDQIQRGLVSSG